MARQKNPLHLLHLLLKRPPLLRLKRLPRPLPMLQWTQLRMLPSARLTPLKTLPLALSTLRLKALPML